MDKDFERWFPVKESIDKEERTVYFKVREIWWCSLGLNVGAEQDGKNELFERPVLVPRKFNKDLFWALPMTSRGKEGRYYYPVRHKGRIYGIILSQLRSMSSKRLLRKIRKLTQEDYQEVRKSVGKLL